MRSLTDLSVTEGHGMRHGKDEYHRQQSGAQSQLKKLYDMGNRLWNDQELDAWTATVDIVSHRSLHLAASQSG